MKNKYTLATYFEKRWWPIIKEILVIALCISLMLAIAILAFKILDYFPKISMTICYSIIALMIIILIFSSIYLDYQDWKKEYYQEQKKIIKIINTRNNNYERQIHFCHLF